MRSTDFLQGFFRPKCLQEQLKHARSGTKISMTENEKAPDWLHCSQECVTESGLPNFFLSQRTNI
jgi:hypothetical protein